MPRRKKQDVEKDHEPIRVRYKDLSDGRKSAYLDIYEHGKRMYKFLHLYLVPDYYTDASEINKEVKRQISMKKADELIRLETSGGGIMDVARRAKLYLCDWMNTYSDRKLKTGQSDTTSRLVKDVGNLLIDYAGNKVTMNNVTPAFCSGFIDYLNEKAVKRNGKPYSAGSISTYFSTFVAAITEAVREKILPSNPIDMLGRDIRKRTKMPESNRSYLTIEEIHLLINTHCGNEQVKRAFLFSCFCGLRSSDVHALRWSDFSKDGQQVKVTIIMEKTREPLVLPLSVEALKWLPERRESADDCNVFHLSSRSATNAVISNWVKRAGIHKQITFHSARHTFATTLLTKGADLYTTSKLLGHCRVTTTEVYAKIVDAKKASAVNLLNGIFEDKDNTNN